MKTAMFTTVAGLAIAAAVVHPAAAHAQEAAAADAGGAEEGIADIVVTASRTGETSAQKTPIAMSVFSADKLDGSLVLNVKDLVAVVPGLNVAQVTASAVIYMRGIGSSNVFGGSDPSVTTQLDGVYIARAFGQFQDFVDIERLEVLRGPQGTLYGRNAIGGTINIISKKPADHFSGKLQLTVGNHEAVTAQGYVSGPIAGDAVSASLAASYVRRDDYFDNILAGRKGTGNAHRGGLRGQIRILPADSVELITRADWSKGEDRFDSYDHLLVPFRPGGANPAPLASSIVGDYHKVAINSPQFNRTKFWGVSQEANADLSDTLALKSLTAYRRSSYRLRVDSDGTELLAAEAGQAEVSRQFSQELNLTLNTDRFSGVLGLFYFRDKTSTDLFANNYASPVVPPAAAFRIHPTPDSFTRSVAAFAQGTYKLTPELGVTAGIRYTRDRKRIEQNFERFSLATGLPSPGFPFIFTLSRSFDAFTPKFGVDWQATPGLLVYGSVTRGFKSGGTSVFANIPADLSFEPETIWSYEAGVKSDLLDRRLRLNASVFRYDYKNLQVQSLIAPGVIAIRNAANARVTGAELEATARPVDALTLTANYALLDAEYQSFPTSSVPNQLAPFLAGDPRYTPATRSYDATGNRLNAAPRHQFSGAAQFNFDLAAGDAFLRAEYYYQSRVFYDPSNAPIFGQRGYGLINASVGWTSADRGWSVQLIGKNLADEQYLITIAANGVVPAGLAGAPRTVALQVTKSW